MKCGSERRECFPLEENAQGEERFRKVLFRLLRQRGGRERGSGVSYPTGWGGGEERAGSR